MKETSKTPNRDALIDYIMKLTPAQVDKFIAHMPLVTALPTLRECELEFLEVFTEEAFIAPKNA